MLSSAMKTINKHVYFEACTNTPRYGAGRLFPDGKCWYGLFLLVEGIMRAMTKKNEAWGRFCDKLHKKIIEENCGCNLNHAADVLISMGYKIDTDAFQDSIEYFENNGGFCDCEILYNV